MSSNLFFEKLRIRSDPGKHKNDAVLKQKATRADNPKNKDRRAFGNQILQRNATIGAENDFFEREADQVSDHVMRMSTQNQSERAHLKNEHSLPMSSSGAGRPMPADLQNYFEPRFGQDLSSVRMHTDKQAQREAKSLNARAFTVGQDISFGKGEYSPESDRGKRLIAHELVHTLQQSGKPPSSSVSYSQAPAQSIQRVSAGEWFRRVFGEGNFEDEELQAYLTFLDDEGRIEDHYDSDNKARAIVARWRRGDSLYLLSARRKILLIREMMSGYTGAPDENAILALLQGSTPTEFSTIISTIGQSTLRDEIHGDQRAEYDRMIRERAATETEDREAAERSSHEVFDDDTVVDLRKRFTENSELAVRRNCIEIIQDLAPRLFSADPEMAERVTAELGALEGLNLKMTEFGRVLSDLGLVSGYEAVRFNPRNGLEEPTEMRRDPWDLIMGMVGDVPGWHIFGLAPFDGYHSVTILVNNRPDGPKVYWADQWRIDPGDDFEEEAGSASGFRRYEKAGFNQWIMSYTQSRWNSVHSPDSKCGERATRRGRDWDRVCRYATTLHIWKFRSRLEGDAP